MRAKHILKRRILPTVVCLFLAALFMTHASAADCDDDSITDMSSSGEFISMLSGHVFQVLGGGEVDSALWLVADDVLICQRVVDYKGKAFLYYEIINTDEDDEKVDAELLR